MALTKPNLSACFSKLTTLLEGFGILTSLTELYLRNVLCLTTFLEGLENLTPLTRLNVSKMFKLENVI